MHSPPQPISSSLVSIPKIPQISDDTTLQIFKDSETYSFILYQLMPICLQSRKYTGNDYDIEDLSCFGIYQQQIKKKELIKLIISHNIYDECCSHAKIINIYHDKICNENLMWSVGIKKTSFWRKISECIKLPSKIFFQFCGSNCLSVICDNLLNCIQIPCCDIICDKKSEFKLKLFIDQCFHCQEANSNIGSPIFSKELFFVYDKEFNQKYEIKEELFSWSKICQCIPIKNYCSLQKYFLIKDNENKGSIIQNYKCRPNFVKFCECCVSPGCSYVADYEILAKNDVPQEILFGIVMFIEDHLKSFI